MAIEFSKGKTTPAARTRLLVSILVGLIAFASIGNFVAWRLAPLLAWDVAALFFLIWVWTAVWHFDGQVTSEHALREDPSRKISDVVMLFASIVSLLAVGVVLAGSADHTGITQKLLIGLAVLSVVLSWVVVHTLFTLRYAELFYSEPEGGVDFGGHDKPSYKDFAYLAFTIGMTFQVSDTGLQKKSFRSAVLKHAALSYLFGTVIVATTINLVAGLSK